MNGNPSGFGETCVMMEAKGELMNPPKYWFLILFLLAIGCAGKQPTAPVYDEKADAHHDIAAAIANAGGEQKEYCAHLWRQLVPRLPCAGCADA